MKHKYIAAALFVAFAAPALADQTAPPTDTHGPADTQASNARAEQIIKRLDTNGDGVISMDEFKYPGARFFKEADLNGDGAVTLDELNKRLDQKMTKRDERMKGHKGKMQARVNQMFKSMDTNRDGRVTPQEAKAYSFKRMDKNADGVLEASELTPQHQRRHWRHHQGDVPPPPKNQ